MHGISSTDTYKRGDIERETVYMNVFGELGASIIELYYFRKSIYGETLKKFGNSRLLELILKTYRYVLKCVRR
jgi:hypothetical protein